MFEFTVKDKKKKKRRYYRQGSSKSQLKKVSVWEKLRPTAPWRKECWESHVVTKTAGLRSWASHRHACDTEGTAAQARPNLKQARLDLTIFSPWCCLGASSHHCCQWEGVTSCTDSATTAKPTQREACSHDSQTTMKTAENTTVDNGFQICTQSILWTSDKKIAPQKF